MPLVVGIDEAGYGPTLGPLVVAATVWRVPASRVAADFWELLRDCVTRSARRNDWRLEVNDSKKVFDRDAGIGSLERPVLCFAHAAGIACDRIETLLGGLGAVCSRPDAPPWERQLDAPLPAARPPARVAELGALVRDRSRAAGVECVSMLAEVVTPADFNCGVQRTHNKASVLLERVLRLIHRAAQVSNGQDLYVHVDRLGGRSDYRGPLMQAFPERHLHITEIGPASSRYRLADARSDWHVDFVVDGDQRHLPVALASMTAKYVRELMMERFNAFWRSLQPQLRPTAGYYTDAQRFLNDIAPLLPTVGIPRDQFIRVC